MVNSAAKLFGRLSLVGILGFFFLNDSAAVPVSRQRIIADKANVVAITPTELRYVRIFITESENGQPCIDELEVYGADDKLNLAATSQGGKATASSCLPGYAIHKVAHLNDGRYGNSHSWIAANTSGDWAQIELASPATVHKVIISRDREGRFRDRIPSGFEVQVSMDGQNWRTVKSVGVGMALPQDERLGCIFTLCVPLRTGYVVKD